MPVEPREHTFLTRSSGPAPVVEYFQRCFRRGRLAHAYLLTGGHEGPKATFALELARALFCATAEPCGACAACRSIESGNHAAVSVFAAGDQRSLDIADVRQLATEDHRRRKGPRLWVLPGVERMGAPAMNALLKTLEEPAPGALLVLLAPSAGSLLPTVVSRCHRVPFPVITGQRGAAPPASRVEDVTREDFFAESGTRDWLGALYPERTDARESLTALLEWLLEGARRCWPEWEAGGAARNGADPLAQLAFFAELRDALGRTTNPDLVLEALVRHLRRSPEALLRARG